MMEAEESESGTKDRPTAWVSLPDESDRLSVLSNERTIFQPQYQANKNHSTAATCDWFGRIKFKTAYHHAWRPHTNTLTDE